jgi:hypothetical protein
MVASKSFHAILLFPPINLTYCYNKLNINILHFFGYWQAICVYSYDHETKKTIPLSSIWGGVPSVGGIGGKNDASDFSDIYGNRRGGQDGREQRGHGHGN